MYMKNEETKDIFQKLTEKIHISKISEIQVFVSEDRF